MERKYIEDKRFDNVDFTNRNFETAEYENCSFHHCDLSNTNLSGATFSECDFVNCNLSLAKLGQTGFREVQFRECKMLGLHFEDCNQFLFAVSFENCVLNLSLFNKLKLPKTKFIRCNLHEVDFSEAENKQMAAKKTIVSLTGQK